MRLGDDFMDEEYRDDQPSPWQIIKYLLWNRAKEKKGTGGGISKEEKEDEKKDDSLVKALVKLWRTINWFFIFLYGWGFLKFLLQVTPLKWIDRVFLADIQVMVGIIFAVFCGWEACLVSRETDKDKFRIGSAGFILGLSAILFLVRKIGKWSLLWAGVVFCSAYAEKIFTDAKIRRVSPKKTRIDLKKQANGDETIDMYKV